METHFVVGCCVFSISLDKLSWPLNDLRGIITTGYPQIWATIVFGECIIVHPDLFVIRVGIIQWWSPDQPLNKCMLKFANDFLVFWLTTYSSANQIPNLVFLVGFNVAFKHFIGLDVALPIGSMYGIFACMNGWFYGKCRKISQWVIVVPVGWHLFSSQLG